MYVKEHKLTNIKSKIRYMVITMERIKETNINLKNKISTDIIITIIIFLTEKNF